MTINEQTRERLKKIFDEIEKRKQTFGKVLVGLAFSRDNKNELRVCFGLVNFLEKGETPFEEITYDYGDFVLTKRLVEVQDALNLIRSIFENQVLKFDRWPEIPMNGSLDEIQFVHSREQYGYSSSEWPRLFTYVSIDGNIRGRIPQRSLSKLGLPLFPNGNEAIGIFLDLDVQGSLDNRIELLIPDYRARIKNLRLDGNKVTVEVKNREIAPKDVLAKFYCKSKNRSYTSEDIPLEAGRASFVIGDEPLQVEAHIFSTLDSNIIDGIKFDYRNPSREEGIIIENIETQLLDIIGKGENINIEFKEVLNRDDFLETVVSFANTGGGTIFLGIDDNCKIKGFKDDVKSKIVDLIADHCDPSIEVQIDSEVHVQGVPITLVKVPEGANKPYFLKDRGIFVRRGSSDRQIKRTELDDIFNAKKQEFSRYSL